MANKYYAVKKGIVPGIYTTWDSASEQVKGFSGAEYKSFPSLEEANDYMGIETKQIEEVINTIDFSDVAIVSVDGSFNKATDTYGYGYIIEYQGETIEGFGGENYKELSSMQQVAGEIIGALRGLSRAIDLNPSEIELHYDFNGIEHWALGTWNANKPYTQRYQQEMKRLMSTYKGQVTFVKDAAHTGIEGNERADDLAKLGAGISV